MYKARFLWSPKAVAMSIANSVDLDCLAVFSSESRELLLSISLFNIYLYIVSIGPAEKSGFLLKLRGFSLLNAFSGVGFLQA